MKKFDDIMTFFGYFALGFIPVHMIIYHTGLV